MQNPATTDESLMLRYCNGDHAAFEALYSRHSHGLYRFIAWQAQRTDLTEEVAQETWISLHFARETYTPSAAFKTLLYQIARNRLVDTLRKQRAIPLSDLSASDESHDNVFDRLIDQTDDDADPESGLRRQQLMRQLHAAIHQLPAEQREVLILYRFSELSTGEISDLTGAGEETVKSRLRYAMQKLRQIMDEPSSKSTA